MNIILHVNIMGEYVTLLRVNIMGEYYVTCEYYG